RFARAPHAPRAAQPLRRPVPGIWVSLYSLPLKRSRERVLDEGIGPGIGLARGVLVILRLRRHIDPDIGEGVIESAEGHHLPFGAAILHLGLESVATRFRRDRVLAAMDRQ